MEKRVFWCVSLSNGETLYEEKGDYKTVAGVLSPWQRLLAHMESIGATITSLSLYAENGARWNIPSAGKAPKFAEFASVKKPVSFLFFRKMGMDTQGPNTGKQDRYAVARGIYDDGRTIEVWVNDETLTSWSVIF